MPTAPSTFLGRPVASGSSSSRWKPRWPSSCAPAALVVLASLNRRASRQRVACQAAKRRQKVAKEKAPTDLRDVREIKKEIKEITSEIADGQGRFASNDQNLKLEFCVRDLEPHNRENLVFDENILGGTWKVLYCSCDALIGGSFGLLNGEATQTFDIKGRKRAQRQVLLKTSFWAGLFAMEWRTVWAPIKGDVIIGEEDWYPFIFGQKIPIISFSIKGAMAWSNIYTDENMRVLRAYKKAKDSVEGLVILEKVNDS